MVDNLSDALYMAAAILIFIVALTVSMSSFSEMKTQVDEIIESDSKIDLVTDNSGNYLNYETAVNNGDVRIVGAETVVSSMYRVAKEKYDVFIKINDVNYLNNLDSSSNSEHFRTTTLRDLQFDKTGTQDRTINAQDLYGSGGRNYGTIGTSGDINRMIVITVDGGRNTIQGKKTILDTLLRDKNGTIEGYGLYNYIREKRFYEFLGVSQQAFEDVSDANNDTKKRVITYVEI